MAHNGSALIGHHDTIGMEGVIKVGIDLGIELGIKLGVEPGIKGSDSKSDIKMTYNVCVDKFTQNRMMAEPNISFQITMVLSAFRWTCVNLRWTGHSSSSHGDRGKSIGLNASSRCAPTMHLKNPLDGLVVDTELGVEGLVPRRPVEQLLKKAPSREASFLQHCSSALQLVHHSRHLNLDMESVHHSRHLDLDMVECHTLP
jgi:hypothetical protein